MGDVNDDDSWLYGTSGK